MKEHSKPSKEETVSTDSSHLHSQISYMKQWEENLVSQIKELQGKKQILESLLEAETSRAEGWKKQYYEIKQKLDFHIAISGNEYTFKPKP